MSGISIPDRTLNCVTANELTVILYRVEKKDVLITCMVCFPSENISRRLMSTSLKHCSHEKKGSKLIKPEIIWQI